MVTSTELEERAQDVIDAAWRVIVRDGISALTVRHVAQEAGIAPSSLRYLFPTQAGLREEAITAVRDRLRARLNRLDSKSEDWAWNALHELLPLDAQRRIEMEVSLALAVAAVNERTLHAIRNQIDRQVYDVCQSACEHLGLMDDDDPRELHALIDGMALHVILRPDSDAGWTRRALRDYIERRQSGIAATQ